MSRKLDALFAERVMGCKVKGVRDPACLCSDRKHADPTNRDYPSDTTIPGYTGSLDAAWLGVEKHLSELDNHADAWFHLERDKDLESPWEAWFDAQYSADGDRVDEGYGNATSPALAIVLACLRAVGVSEEEIAAAQQP